MKTLKFATTIIVLLFPVFLFAQDKMTYEQWEMELANALETGTEWLKQTFVHGEVVDFSLLIPFCLALLFTLALPHFRRETLDPVSRSVIGISALMLGAGLAISMVVRFETRYWNFLIPFTVLTTVLVWSRVSPLVPLLCAAILLPSGFDELQARRLRKLPPEYESVPRLVPEDAVLYTSNPWEISFHTERHTVALPYSDWDEFWALAERFGVTHIVIVHRDARHRMYDGLERGRFPRGIEKIHYSESLVIGSLNRDRAIGITDRGIPRSIH